MSTSVDIKLSFQQYDCVPGPKCREFRRNLLQLGARTDDRGHSLADCYLRQDEEQPPRAQTSPAYRTS